MLEGGALFSEKEQDDAGPRPDAVALGLCVVSGWGLPTEGDLQGGRRGAHPCLSREKKPESTPVLLGILHFGLKNAAESL